LNLPEFPFVAVDWTDVESKEYSGDTGKAVWRTKFLGDLRIRLVEYSPNYSANHWCSKGHILFILSGEMTTELQDGREFYMTEGMSYLAGDDGIPHRSRTINGARLLIID
jgi:hypothetical protein